ncbi:PadR family transcriptional regulator [Bacillus massiliigorillae]|uniref:PadR family transcriptional regulator n=1 Tax=Bacillus massiliigorillae TaxID=1243664 RepID=UPI0003A328C9|nr:PadR family transcriptional regulator [Bacillus massiliigorillae]
MTFDRELMKGSSSLIIMNILKDGDMYGYQLSKEMERKSDEQLAVKEGTLYPALHKLEQKGYIQSYIKKQEKTPSRKYYTLTEEGRQLLKHKNKEWSAFAKMINKMIGNEI